MDDVSKLTKLGSNTTKYVYEEPDKGMLEVFPNQDQKDYAIHLEFPEFTSLCPKTGQPDFGTIIVDYTPSEWCVESKSLKMYFFAYRNYGSFMESLTNKILRDLVGATHPKFMQVQGVFAPRGALRIVVTAQYSIDTGYVMKVAS